MIVVVGEALIDLIESKTQKGSYQAVVGGANANVAIALARLQAPAQFLARISSDAFGQIIRKRLEENGVGLDHAIAATEPTTVAIASIGPTGGATYAFYVQGTADWGWTTKELPDAASMERMHAKAIQFGCLTMAMPPGNKVIEEWSKHFFDHNALTISHDINVRPALGFDPDDERERVERLNSSSHLIKASDDDIHWLYGLQSGSSVDEIVWNWIEGTERIVFVTRGGDGVTIYRKEDKLEVPARKVEVQDTVGAGDTFCANLLNQLLEIDALGSDPFDRLGNIRNQDLVEMAKVAAVAASIACQRVGAEPPTKSELKEALKASS